MPDLFVDPARAIHWILDWDGTFTTRDTLDTLVNIAKEAKSDPTIPQKWEHVSNAYLSDFTAALEKQGKLPSTVLGERNLLKSLEQVEKRSIERVSTSGIFRGLRARDIRLGARHACNKGAVQLRTGADDFLRWIASHRMISQVHDLDLVDVLSVNWSQHFITECLDACQVDLTSICNPTYKKSKQEKGKQYGITKDEELQELLAATDTEYVDRCKRPYTKTIYANELEDIDGDLGSTGVICVTGDHKIISSRDKLHYLQESRKVNPYMMKPIPIVYIGDSWTDFECLLAADLGICIRSDPITSSQKKLKNSLKRVGIRCPHIEQWKDADDWYVMWALDFDEIKDWFRKLERDSLKSD